MGTNKNESVDCTYTASEMGTDYVYFEITTEIVEQFSRIKKETLKDSAIQYIKAQPFY